MEMTAPLIPNEVLSPALDLPMALLIGIGFGFFLERAGFGSAKKLVAQFYLTDLAVFKVMFTAIVTAMVGVAVLGRVGFLDVASLPIIGTYIVPEIVGGLILGVGFVVGGYCPGTSVAAIATGKIDAMVYGAGIFFGMFVFAELSSVFDPFVNSTSMGPLTLPQYFNLPTFGVVVAVVAMALGGFYGAGILEKKFGTR
jgi:uncharacterized membrane protein YedE/YeeE